ncbi:hypothetical protein D3C80_1589330 [compost metagenome]
MRPSTGVGCIVGVNKKAHDRGRIKTGTVHHRVKILPVEDILGEIIFRNHRGRLSRQLFTRQSFNDDRPVHYFSGEPFCRVFQLIGHKTTIDQNEPAILQSQRRVNVISGLSAMRGKEVAFAGMVK